MNTQFEFDQKTGTIVSRPEVMRNKEEDVKSSANIKPIDKSAEVNMVGTPASITIPHGMKVVRTNDVTPMQLIGDNGLPESYLTPTRDDIVMFKEDSDYTICRIADEKSGRTLVEIGGYALKFSFNTMEMNTPEKIEQALQGLTKLFRHQFMMGLQAQSK